MFSTNKSHTSGLHNLGNTCYLSSVIQCLAYSHSLTNYLTDNEYDEDLRLDSPSTQFSKEFRTLIVQLWIKNGVVNPNNFKQIVDMNMLKNGWKGHMVGWQNDAHEFLEFVLDTLHESLKYQPKISISVKVDDDSLTATDKLALEAYKRWQNHFDKGYSNIIDSFYGQFLSEIKKGEEVSHCFDPFQVLTLEIPTKKNQSGKKTEGNVSLIDCFDKFMETEKITDTINKTFYFWRTPKNLIIVLKRFNNNGSKDSTRVNYTDILDLSKFSKGYKREKIIYRLYGICCHHGNGPQFGHYFSLCRKHDSDKWFKLDDENVEPLGRDGALPLTSSAYILFYHLI